MLTRTRTGKNQVGGIYVCETCNYPYQGHACDNPGCTANPKVPEATKERWRRQQEENNRRQVERDRLNNLRNESYGGRRR